MSDKACFRQLSFTDRLDCDRTWHEGLPTLPRSPYDQRDRQRLGHPELLLAPLGLRPIATRSDGAPLFRHSFLSVNLAECVFGPNSFTQFVIDPSQCVTAARSRAVVEPIHTSPER